ncbi:hypothetical protein D3C73_1262290 [compost metagenome]
MANARSACAMNTAMGWNRTTKRRLSITDWRRSRVILQRSAIWAFSTTMVLRWKVTTNRLHTGSPRQRIKGFLGRSICWANAMCTAMVWSEGRSVLWSCSSLPQGREMPGE